MCECVFLSSSPTAGARPLGPWHFLSRKSWLSRAWCWTAGWIWMEFCQRARSYWGPHSRYWQHVANPVYAGHMLCVHVIVSSTESLMVLLLKGCCMKFKCTEYCTWSKPTLTEDWMTTRISLSVTMLTVVWWISKLKGILEYFGRYN